MALLSHFYDIHYFDSIYFLMYYIKMDNWDLKFYIDVSEAESKS